MKIADFVLDQRTAKLLKVAKAFVLAEDVTASTGRSVVNAAQAIRSLAEAGEATAAGDLAERLGKMASQLEVENPSLDWSTILERHCAGIVSAAGPGRQVA